MLISTVIISVLIFLFHVTLSHFKALDILATEAIKPEEAPDCPNNKPIKKRIVNLGVEIDSLSENEVKYIGEKYFPKRDYGRELSWAAQLDQTEGLSVTRISVDDLGRLKMGDTEATSPEKQPKTKKKSSKKKLVKKKIVKTPKKAKK